MQDVLANIEILLEVTGNGNLRELAAEAQSSLKEGKAGCLAIKLNAEKVINEANDEFSQKLSEITQARDDKIAPAHQAVLDAVAEYNQLEEMSKKIAFLPV